MALLGNYSVLLKTPGRFLAGSTISDNRANFNNSGSTRGLFSGWAGFESFTSVPNGYTPGYSWTVAKSSGGIASNQMIFGSGGCTGPTGSLAGGYNFVGSLTGTGDIVNAEVLWVIYGSASLSGDNSFSAGIIGISPGSASLTGDANILGFVNASVYVIGSLTGDSSTLGSIAGVLNTQAALTGDSLLIASIAGAVLGIGSLTGTGELFPNIIGTWNVSSSLTGGDFINFSVQGYGNFSAGITTQGTLSADSFANGFIASDISSSGEILTTNSIAAAVWSAIAEGSLTYQEVQRLLLAVAAGKTAISGTTVYFRDSEDTTDRIVAGMSGSERTTVTLNGA